MDIIGAIKAVAEAVTATGGILGKLMLIFRKSGAEKAADAVKKKRDELDKASRARPPKLKSIVIVFGLGLGLGQGCASAYSWFNIDGASCYAIDPDDSGKQDGPLAKKCPVVDGKFVCAGMPMMEFDRLRNDLAACVENLKECQKQKPQPQGETENGNSE